MELILKAKHIKGGQFEYYAHPSYVEKMLSDVDDADVLVSITKYSNKRSLAQNAYYRGIVLRDIQEFVYDTQGERYSKEYIHQYHLHKFVGMNIDTKEMFGELVPIMGRKTTSGMSVKEMAIFLEQVINMWLERGCMISQAEKE